MVLEVIGLLERKAAGRLGDGALREGRASDHSPSILRDGPSRRLRAGPQGLLRIIGPGAGPTDTSRPQTHRLPFETALRASSG